MEQIVIPSDPGTRMMALARTAKKPLREDVRTVTGNQLMAQLEAPDVALEGILEFLRSTTAAIGAGVAMLDGATLRCWASVGLAPAPASTVALDNTLAGECVRTGQIIGCIDTVRARPEALPARSLLLIPLPAAAGVAGLIGLFWREPHGFTDSTVLIAQAVASAVAVAFGSGKAGETGAQGELLSADLGQWPLRAPAAQDQTPKRRLLGLPCPRCGAFFYSDESVCPACGNPKLKSGTNPRSAEREA